MARGDTRRNDARCYDNHCHHWVKGYEMPMEHMARHKNEMLQYNSSEWTAIIRCPCSIIPAGFHHPNVPSCIHVSSIQLSTILLFSIHQQVTHLSLERRDFLFLQLVVLLHFHVNLPPRIQQPSKEKKCQKTRKKCHPGQDKARQGKTRHKARQDKATRGTRQGTRQAKWQSLPRLPSLTPKAA